MGNVTVLIYLLSPDESFNSEAMEMPPNVTNFYHHQITR